jgi:hypothetical protein
MKQYFDLDSAEKRLEYILLFLFVLLAVVIATGVYFQAHGIDHDRLLIPVFFAICGTYFLLFGRNALSNGKLTAKWTPFYIFALLKFALTRLLSLPKEKAVAVTRKIIGGLALFVSAVCFSFAVWDIARHL